MWCYISASNSIHSLPSWIRSTSLDSAFPLLGYLSKIFHHALQLHSPSNPERNPSENAKNATSRTCGNQAFHNFQSNMTPPLHSRFFDDFQEILPQSFENLAKYFSPNRIFVPPALQMPTFFLFVASQRYPPLTFA